MKYKYIVENGEVVNVEGEEHIKEEYFNFNGVDLKVMVTSQKIDKYKEKYHNFYIISNMFKKEPLNNLDIQQPSEIIEKMTDAELLRLMEERAISYYLWYKYHRDYSVISEEIPN